MGWCRRQREIGKCVIKKSKCKGKEILDVLVHVYFKYGNVNFPARK